MNASNALAKKKIKVRKVIEEELKKAKKRLAKAELAEREALKRIGIAACKARNNRVMHK